MSLPREILPGRFYLITRRCTQRQFLLRPDDETTNAFTYLLAEAAQRFDIEVVLPVVLSNHHHTVVYDRHGRIVEFIEHLHKFVAKAQNVLRGRSENLWSSEPANFVHLVDPADVIDKLVYAATNPVKDGLVEHAYQWPGLNGLSALLNDRPLTGRRPRHYFSADGCMPETATVRLVIPAELGDADEVRRVLRERVAIMERELAAERARTGVRVLGRRAVLAQSWRAHPTTEAPRRQLNPRVAARDNRSRREALERHHAFVAAYRDARRRWRTGQLVVFPAGTYWLRRFANVPIAPCPAA